MRPDPEIVKKLAEIVKLATENQFRSLAFCGVTTGQTAMLAWWTFNAAEVAELENQIEALKDSLDDEPDGGMKVMRSGGE